MLSMFEQFLPPILGVAAVAYAGLAVRVSRAGPQYANSMISYLMFLLAGIVGGTAFSYGATDPVMYDIGQVLSYFSAGFLPIVFYIIYREYTAGSTGALIIATMSIIPIATTALALTNGMQAVVSSNTCTGEIAEQLFRVSSTSRK